VQENDRFKMKITLDRHSPRLIPTDCHLPYPPYFSHGRRNFKDTNPLKVVTSEKIGWSGVASTLGTWHGGVVMGVLLSFDKAAILYIDFISAPSEKQNIIVFAANNSICCECHVAPTILL
jgi:hypothetical protein